MNMTTLMVQGTTSDAGKTVMVAALARIFARHGRSVAPFKPQNMALNSAVASDGGEIGRAQALQAQACYLEPHSDMNPVLLKPSSDTGAQVIIHGKALSNMEAGAYHDYKKVAMQAVLASHKRLSEKYELIVVEGAGSPAEINLREGDIANMGFAEAIDCPVIIVADIDKGGVFAHLVGTLALLSNSEQARVVGFIINRFRGDIKLLQPGIDWLEARCQKPVLAVMPYLHHLYLDAEDAINCEQPNAQSESKRLKVVVPVLPRISNHTDFDALRLHEGVDLEFVAEGRPIPSCDLIVLPGSKNVRGDLQWLRDQAWPEAIQRHLRYGGKVLGICGGYQMLGHDINDPHGVEQAAGSSKGLGLLPLTTSLQQEKHVQRRTGRLLIDEHRPPFEGYEIHCGESRLLAPSQAFLSFGTNEDVEVFDGCISDDRLVMGTYMHGIFDRAEACDRVLAWAGIKESAHTAVPLAELREQQLDRLADALETCMDFDRLSKATGVRYI